MSILSALYSGGSAIYYNGFMVVDGAALGRFRFLKDHEVDGEYIMAGDIRTMYSTNWSITADVEPLDATAVQSFYDAGPSLGAVIRTQYTPSPISRPVTFWYQVAPQRWALSGLGAALAPISEVVSRIEDKEP